MDSAIDILSFSYMHENAIGSGTIAYNLTKTLNALNVPCRAFVIKSYEKTPYVVGLDNIDPFFRYQCYFLALLRKSGLIGIRPSIAFGIVAGYLASSTLLTFGFIRFSGLGLQAVENAFSVSSRTKHLVVQT